MGTSLTVQADGSLAVETPAGGGLTHVTEARTGSDPNYVYDIAIGAVDVLQTRQNGATLYCTSTYFVNEEAVSVFGSLAHPWDTAYLGTVYAATLSTSAAETSDPSVTGELYTDAGLLRISGTTGTAVEIISQANAEAGTATDPQQWTAERVSQAIAAQAAGAESPLVLTAASASEVPLEIEAAASQTGNLSEINSNGGSGGDLQRTEDDGTFCFTHLKALSTNQNIQTSSGLTVAKVTGSTLAIYQTLTAKSAGVDIGTSSIRFNTGYLKNLNLGSLGTSDPVVAGELWNDSGTLKISAG